MQRRIFRLTHEASGFAVDFDATIGRSLHRSHAIARRWLSSVVRHHEKPRPAPILRTYTLAPAGIESVRQGGRRLATGRDEVIAMLDGRLTSPILRSRESVQDR